MKDPCGRQPFVQKQEIRLGALALLLSVIYCASTGRKKRCIGNTQDRTIPSSIVRLFIDAVSRTEYKDRTVNDHQHVICNFNLTESFSYQCQHTLTTCDRAFFLAVLSSTSLQAQVCLKQAYEDRYGDLYICNCTNYMRIKGCIIE